jgi:stress-induced morphogen
MLEKKVMDAIKLEELIRQEIPDAVIDIRDVRGDGLYFDATVVSGQFTGLTRIQQHRRVHRALEGVIGNDVHALKLTTRETK